MVVFDGVAGPDDARLFETRDRRDHRALHLFGQRGRDAVRIDGVVVETFRLEKDLMPVALAEAHDLVLDRRTVARPAAVDLTGIHRRAMQIGADRSRASLRRRRVMPHAICGVARSRRSGTRTAPADRRRGCISSAAQSMVLPSSRGGVPVLRRPSEARAAPGSAAARSPAPRRHGRPGSVSRRYGSGRAGRCRWSGPRRRRRVRGRPSDAHRRPGRRAITRSSASASIDGQVRLFAADLRLHGWR